MEGVDIGGSNHSGGRRDRVGIVGRSNTSSNMIERPLNGGRGDINNNRGKCLPPFPKLTHISI